jgi:hypothetical protein
MLKEIKVYPHHRKSLKKTPGNIYKVVDVFEDLHYLYQYIQSKKPIRGWEQ